MEGAVLDRARRGFGSTVVLYSTQLLQTAAVVQRDETWSQGDDEWIGGRSGVAGVLRIDEGAERWTDERNGGWR